MSSIKQEAERLRLHLLMGLIDRNRVVAWADATIKVMKETPFIELIDVSLAGDQALPEMAQLLRAIPGEEDLAIVAHQALGLLWEKISFGGISLEKGLEMLRIYMQEAAISEEERSHLDWLFELCYLLREGHSTHEELRERLFVFLGEHAVSVAPV